MERDPAARSALEVVLCYPGRARDLGPPRLPRPLEGGLDDPGPLGVPRQPLRDGHRDPSRGASLGPGLFIDHGMGIVIGETAEVGENVTLLQGVTLGGTSIKREKRHPTLGDNVVVGAGAKILGGFTIGSGQPDRRGLGGGRARCPENSVVVGVPGPGNIPRRGAGRRHRPEPDRSARPAWRGRSSSSSTGSMPSRKRSSRSRSHSRRPSAHVIPKDTMTVKEASTYLSMDADALKRLAVERRIPALEHDGQWLFSKKSIDKWRTRTRADGPDGGCGPSSPNSRSPTVSASTRWPSRPPCGPTRRATARDPETWGVAGHAPRLRLRDAPGGAAAPHERRRDPPGAGRVARGRPRDPRPRRLLGLSAGLPTRPRALRVRRALGLHHRLRPRAARARHRRARARLGQEEAQGQGLRAHGESSRRVPRRRGARAWTSTSTSAS